MPAVILLAVIKSIDYLAQRDLIWVAKCCEPDYIRTSGEPTNIEWPKVITLMMVHRL